MAQPPVFLAHPASLAHDTGPHPERAERIVAIETELERRGWLGFERVRSPAASRESITAVHTDRYVDAIEAASARGGAQLDLDTVTSAGSFAAALRAAGGAITLVDLLLDRAAPSGFSAHRPPGHHATVDRAMGFCLFNNVAIAARHALAQRGLERVLVFDWDVHHGNGTNDIFHGTDQVLFISVHQWPLYPGTGSGGDVGSGQGEGYTVNLPVPGGSGDDAYRSLVDHVAVPLAHQFEPQLILISAGYDAHREDPLASCEVTEEGFATMARSLLLAGAELGVPVGFVLEGGYALGALARSVAATLEAVAAGPRPVAAAASTSLAAEARARLAPWWPALS